MEGFRSASSEEVENNIIHRVSVWYIKFGPEDVETKKRLERPQFQRDLFRSGLLWEDLHSQALTKYEKKRKT